MSDKSSDEGDLGDQGSQVGSSTESLGSIENPVTVPPGDPQVAPIRREVQWPAVIRVASPIHMTDDWKEQDDAIGAVRRKERRTIYRSPLSYVGLPPGPYNPEHMNDEGDAADPEWAPLAHLPLPFPLHFLDKWPTLTITSKLRGTIIWARGAYRRFYMHAIHPDQNPTLSDEAFAYLNEVACIWHDLRSATVAPGRYQIVSRGVRFSLTHREDGSLRISDIRLKRTDQPKKKKKKGGADKSPVRVTMPHIEDAKPLYLPYLARIVHEAKGAFGNEQRTEDAGYDLNQWSLPSDRSYCGVPSCANQWTSNAMNMHLLGKHWNSQHNKFVRVAKCPLDRKSVV